MGAKSTTLQYIIIRVLCKLLVIAHSIMGVVCVNYRIAGNFRGVKYSLFFRGQADLYEMLT